MISRSLLIAPLLLTVSALADDTPAPMTAKEMLRSRLAEEAAKPAPPAPAPAPTRAAPPGSSAKPAAPLSSGDKNPLLTTSAPPPPAEDAKAKAPTTVLPKVEVKRSRITELDRQLAQEDRDIAREKKNAKPSELDKALNSEKVAKPLSIFGGESDKFRSQVSSERVGLMEDEKDLLEAIAQAKTPAEKAELKKQLDALREERRLLEQTAR